MNQKDLLKRSKKTLNVIFAILLITLLIVKVDWHFVMKELRHLDWRWLTAYFFLQLIAIFFSVKKWQSILVAYKISLSVKDGFLTYLKGMFLNNFLPTTIGGDAYRCWWLGEKTGLKMESYASVVLDRILGLFVTLCIGLVSFVFIMPLIEKNGFFVFIYIGFFFATLVAALVLVHFLFGRKVLPVGQIPFLQKPFFQALFVKRSWKDYQEILFWSGAFSVAGLLISNYVLFLAFGIPLPPLAFAAIMLIVILFSNLPVSINNIGIKEWSYATFFVFLGIPIESAVAVALLSRVFQMVISLMAVPLSLSLEGDMIFANKPKQTKDVIGEELEIL